MLKIGLKTGAVLAGAAVLVCGGLTLTAMAQSARPPGYLPREALPDSLLVIGPPPESGSALDKADHERFKDSRKMMGGPRWTQAQQDVELFGAVAHKSFACAIGKAITPEATPVLSSLLDRVVIDAGGSTYAAKNRYSRTRPMIGNDEPICVPREDWMKTNGSYPSGHAAAGWAWGLILAELAPDKATEAATRAREFGDSRWICGVHFQSDVEAGRVMGAATVARLHADPAFMADMAKAKAELEKAPAAQGCGG
ncbi:MAG: phosphatase PAP2 family protein [Caulobacter sp.]|nr:phosphatase PAP2 family protein [Caulobacter sp.]